MNARTPRATNALPTLIAERTLVREVGARWHGRHIGIIRSGGVESFEISNEVLGDRQLLLAHCLGNALRELVATVVVVVRVVDLAAGRRKGPRGFFWPKR